MTPEDIRRHIENGTLMHALMKEVELTAHRDENKQTKLEIRFPEWYEVHISPESKEQIESLILENADARLKRP